MNQTRFRFCFYRAERKKCEALTAATLQQRCSKRWATCWRWLILFRGEEMRRRQNQSSGIVMFYRSIILHAGPICTCFRFVSTSQGHFLSVRPLWSSSSICLCSRGYCVCLRARACVWKGVGDRNEFPFFDFISNSVLSLPPLVSKCSLLHTKCVRLNELFAHLKTGGLRVERTSSECEERLASAVKMITALPQNANLLGD